MAKSTVEECHSLLAAVCVHPMDRKREGNEGCHIFFQWISHLSRKVETLRLLVAARRMVDYRVKSSAELKV